MNGRIHEEDETPEGRIAAVAVSICREIDKKFPGREPDYADFRAVLGPFIQREILNALIDETRKTSGKVLSARMQELSDELLALKFPNGYGI